ncbi:hypothetical protein HDZ31DRAFT_40393 [Schizophyllum fasciatum]
MVNPSPEVCKRIVSFLNPFASSDLKTLCLTSKAFERAARPVLYRLVSLTEFNQAISFTQRIRDNPELGKMIYELRIITRHQLRLPAQALEEYTLYYWKGVLEVLARAPNLTALFIYDSFLDTFPPLSADAVFPFQLERCTLRLCWNDSLVRFLTTQHALSVLQCYDLADERGTLAIPDGCWPKMHSFAGSLTSAMEIAEGAAPRLQCLCLRLDTATSPTVAYYLPQLDALRPTLRSLKLVGLDAHDVDSAISAAARFFPDLQFIGALPLPPVERTAFCEALTRFNDLRHIQVDLNRWRPQPQSPAPLRAIVTQLKIFAPTLRMVTIWMPHGKWMWMIRDGEWEPNPDATQALWNCNSWIDQVDLPFLAGQCP